jgi:hypothetical protein
MRRLQKRYEDEEVFRGLVDGIESFLRKEGEYVQLYAIIVELGTAGRGLPEFAPNNTRNLQISSRSPRTGQSRARWWWDVRNISTIVYQEGIRFGCNGSLEKLKPESITQREFSEHQNLPKQDLLFLGENLSVELQFLTSLEQ